MLDDCLGISRGVGGNLLEIVTTHISVTCVAAHALDTAVCKVLTWVVIFACAFPAEETKK